MSILTGSPLASAPFSLQEFNALVAHALDAGHFSETFLAQPSANANGLETNFMPEARMATESATGTENITEFEHCAPELMADRQPHLDNLQGGTIAHAPTAKGGRNRGTLFHFHKHGHEASLKEKGDRGGVEIPLPHIALHLQKITHRRCSRSPSSSAAHMAFNDTDMSVWHEDRGPGKSMLAKIKRHVLRAAPITHTSKSTLDVKHSTHRTPAIPVISPYSNTATSYVLCPKSS